MDSCRIGTRATQLGVLVRRQEKLAASNWRAFFGAASAGVPLVLLPGLCLAFRSHLPSWSFMWLMLLVIVAGCKWMTWLQAVGQIAWPSVWRSLGYLFAWPGMNATAFLNLSCRVRRPAAAEWGQAVCKTALGAVLVWGLVRNVPSDQSPIAGGVGMVGLAFLIHFGVFHLLALAWQRVGVAALHIFRSPGRARSVTDFWGARWNLAFRELAHSLIYRPLVSRLGVVGASLAAFLVSGFVHELLISVPARAGYGLPTAYFLIQWLGVLMERSSIGKRLRLRRGSVGWLFTLIVTAGPACLLFHPPFLIRVMMPFLQAINAL